MSAKHTPGPWKSDDDNWVLDSTGSHFVSVRAEYKTKEEVEATRNLIAAAPDLLEACESAIEEFKDQECNCDGAPDANYACYFHRIERALKAAISKATGGAK